MKVKFANRIYEVLFTKELAGLTMYAVEDEPNHIDWLINVEVIDDKKKELKKIEQKPAEWHREDEQNLNACLGYIPDEFLRRWLTDAIHVKYDNPAWSEEDEARFESCIKVLQTSDGYDTINAKWLKSLKERVQPLPKQEWGEEDESEIDILCHFLEEYGERYYGYIPLQNTISWLRTLKDRYTWKPSDEQIRALNYYLKNHIDNDGVFGSQLVKLYQDLLKLREE